MPFIAKKVETLPGFGDKLREARENAGLSLVRAAQISNVKVGYLEKLEKSEIDRMPPEVYTKAFLRRYGKLLELDEEELIKTYQNELKILSHLKNKPGQHQSLPALQIGRVIAPRYLSFGLIGLLLLFLLGYLSYEIHFLISPPSLEIFEPGIDAIVQEENLSLKGKTESGAKLVINGQQLNVEMDGQFEQEITLTPGLNEIKIEAINRFDKTSSVIRKILYQQPENQEPILNTQIQLDGTSGTN